MTIKEVLAKIIAGEELTAEEKTFMADYKEPDIDAAANAKSKKERLKAEATKTDLEAQLQEAQDQLEAAQAGDSEVEKLKRDIERANAKIEAQTATTEAEKTAHQATRRDAALSKVQVPWLDSVNQKLRNTLLTDHLKDIETDDLGDADVTNALVETFKTEYAPLMNSGASSGAGTTPAGSDVKVQAVAGTKVEFNKNSDYNELRPRLDAAWKAADAAEQKG